MKTSELIKLLQDADPKDECRVCIGNCPVKEVQRDVFYWDGREEYVLRDENDQVIKVGFPDSGDKINIHRDSIDEALMDNPEAEIDLAGIMYQGQPNPRYKEYVDKCVQKGLEYQAWHKAFKEAKENGTEPPQLSRPAKTFKGKFTNWLKKHNLIEIEQ